MTEAEVQLWQLSSSSSLAITAQLHQQRSNLQQCQLRQPCSLAALQPCSLAALQPCSRAAWQPCSLAALQPGSLAALQPCSRAALQPCSRAALRPCGHAALRPCGLAALQLYTCAAPICSLAAPSNRPAALQPYGLAIPMKSLNTSDANNSLTAQPPTKSLKCQRPSRKEALRLQAHVVCLY